MARDAVDAPSRLPGDVVLTPAAAARQLGVAVSTLRSWDRRHGIGPSRHEPGRHRRYTVADLGQLRQMMELIDQGVAVARAAELVRDERATAAARTAEAPDGGAGAGARAAQVAVRRLRIMRGATERLDAETIRRVVIEALDEQGTVEAWERLLVPYLTELGEICGRPGGPVEAEHVSTGAIVAALHSPVPVAASRDTPPVLLACAPDEQHSLPLEALRRALAERRRRAAVLGARVPAESLLGALARTAPNAVFIWAHTAELAHRVPVGDLAQAGVPLLVAGPGWAGVPVPAGTRRPGGMAEAVAMLA